MVANKAAWLGPGVEGGARCSRSFCWGSLPQPGLNADKAGVAELSQAAANFKRRALSNTNF